MLRYLWRLLRPPSRDELGKYWQGLLTGGAFATLLVLLGDSKPWELSIVQFGLEAFFIYVITMLSVIGHRYAAEEKK